MDIAGIQALIPHRPPFLWLDEVLSIDDRSLRARKVIDRDLDLFRGHYPSFPVLPGVLQIEAALQAAAVLIAHGAPAESGRLPVVTRLNNVQFRRLVRPGDVLEIEVELSERLGSAFYLKGRTLVDGKVSLRMEFACTLTEAGRD